MNWNDLLNLELEYKNDRRVTDLVTYVRDMDQCAEMECLIGKIRDDLYVSAVDGTKLSDNEDWRKLLSLTGFV